MVDIQGVDDLYTDPQIHTAAAKRSFGRGNMGLRGMALFFASHRRSEEELLKRPVKSGGVRWFCI